MASKNLRWFLLFLFVSVCCAGLVAQPKKKKGKYPSLLWEISGNGLKKPSYLFGTMHVSNKMVFHLNDSFYMALRNTDKVALELNPELWQEEVMKEEETGGNIYSFRSGSNRSGGGDYLFRTDFAIGKYENQLEDALLSKPYVINSLLYRTSSNAYADFEEDTYLDLYIYQCGRKLGKKVSGLENYQESERLTKEAYKDAAKDKNKKRRNRYDYDDDDAYSPDKLDEAYRKGDLDLLDSINKRNSISAAFDEKFLLRRNDIQAYSIDTIIKKGESLFAAVGAAHLPGSRGVIESLRKMGYILRPVKMGEIDSRQKNIIEQLQVPMTGYLQTSTDGFFKAEVPGKLYRVGGYKNAFGMMQYSDMSNGCYYMVTRLKTRAGWWGHSQEQVLKKVDSILYDNIPGKLLSKQRIVKNGYPGFDVLNRTRRGDVQRRHIIVTPFEIFFFKASGTGEYVKTAPPVQKFFSSLQLKEFKSGEWQTFTPPLGGFEIKLPHQPLESFSNGSTVYEAADPATKNRYMVMRQDYYQEEYLSPDSFDLELMSESFAHSRAVDTMLSAQPLLHQGYRALDCRYRLKNGQYASTRFIIRGPHYYALAAASATETSADGFFNSFNIQPYRYPEPVLRTDTNLKFTVKSPVFPVQKESDDEDNFSLYRDYYEEAEEEYGGGLMDLVNVQKSLTVKNDTTGEKIDVSFTAIPAYMQIRDSASVVNMRYDSLFLKLNFNILRNQVQTLPDSTRLHDVLVGSAGSTRRLWLKTWEKDGQSYTIQTTVDSNSAPSAFISSFFSTFKPADTIRSSNPYGKKSPVFFKDFFGADTIARKKALRALSMVHFDSTDLPQLFRAVESLSWGVPNYLSNKQSFISALGTIKTGASLDYLKQLYRNAGDTVTLQHSILEAMLNHKTANAFAAFRDIVLKEPPVLQTGDGNTDKNDFISMMRNMRTLFKRMAGSDFGSSAGFLQPLYDTMQLTKTILPDLLTLMSVDEYKPDMMQLLGRMIDSNLVTAGDYRPYFNKFLLEAKQELKKQAIAEKAAGIENKESEAARKLKPWLDDDGDEKTDEGDGNKLLEMYARLLRPYRKDNSEVQSFFTQLLKSGDNKLKYDIMMLLVKTGEPVPDTLITWFAAKNQYYVQLYNDLLEAGRKDQFPAKLKSQEAYCRNQLQYGSSGGGSSYLSYLSHMMYSGRSSKADSLVLLERSLMELGGKKGVVYFYKYRKNKDNPNWYLAIAGMMPADSSLVTMADTAAKKTGFTDLFSGLESGSDILSGGFLQNILELSAGMKEAQTDITRLTDIKVNDAAALAKAIREQKKKMRIESHPAGKKFYGSYSGNYGNRDEDETEAAVEDTDVPPPPPPPSTMPKKGH